MLHYYLGNLECLTNMNCCRELVSGGQEESGSGSKKGNEAQVTFDLESLTVLGAQFDS